MRLSPYFVIFLVVLLTGVLLGCTNQSSPSGSGQFAAPAPPADRVFAVSYPLQFLTQQIVGDEIEVLIPFGKSDDPRKSRPTRQTIEAMQESDLVVANGIGARYAKWMAVVSLPQSKIINTASRGLALREFIQIKGEAIVHSHGPEGEHSHPVMAARSWLDPSLAKKQASYISKQLKNTYPERADQFEENLGRLHTRLDELIAHADGLIELCEQKSPTVLTAGSQLLFFSRFAGLESQTIPGLSGNSHPTDDQILSAVEGHLKSSQKPAGEGIGDNEDTASSHNGDVQRLVIVPRRSQLSKGFSDRLKTFGVQSVEFDLLDHPPSEGDYIEAMKMNIVRVQEALQR